MRPVGEPQASPASSAGATSLRAIRRTPIRVVRAANDNHRTHAPWRRFVAASMAALFAASLILVGLVCIAQAGEGSPSVVTSR